MDAEEPRLLSFRDLYSRDVKLFFSPLPSVLASQGFCNKVHEPGGLKQQIYIVWQFWSLEIQDQDVNRVDSFRELWRRLCSMPSS